MRCLSASFLLIVHAVQLAIGAGPLSPQGDPVVVDVGYAKYRGNLSFPDTRVFYGIPYAEAPIGERRFREPVPLDTRRVAKESAGGIIDATSPPDFCVQADYGGSEDCLKVNIYSPTGSTSRSKLPVLFYIHGGGFAQGNPMSFPFTHWVHQSPNVVIVSVYYRLASFGFLATPEFNDPRYGDFNAGFKDQIQALKWVKRNIRAFGGDPNQVTINGESAGGSSVQLLLIANLEERLFHKALAQSPARLPLQSPAEKKSAFDAYAVGAGCGKGNIATRMRCLRSVDTTVLAAAQRSILSQIPFMYAFTPLLDGKLVPGYPTHLFRTGNYARVPLMVGTTTNDSVAFGPLALALKTSYPLLTNADIEEYLKIYPASAYSSQQRQTSAGAGDTMFHCARHVMSAVAAEKATNVWTYRYNQQNPTSLFPQEPDQVGHAAENWMMFDGVNTPGNGTAVFTGLNPTQSAFSRELIAYWLSFVRSGNPNTHKLKQSPHWPRFDKRKKNRIVLQQGPNGTTDRSGSFMEMESPEEIKRCAFVLSKFERHQN